ncbi:MAG: Rieske 2Fe-2S domain-containing protein [Candidatus Sericytochromatia bacterium]|nr:Rieske 2Fe-2S domain-containing protein [Candidatus Sericytochromatia bacterium]
MHLHHAVADHWAFLGHDGEISSTAPLVRAIGSLVLVAFRSHGRLVVAKDDCPHQGASFAGSRIVDECLVCPFHGWTFDQEGCYVQGFRGNMPEPVRQTLRLERYPARSRDGRIWVMPTPTSKFPPDTLIPAIFSWYAAACQWRVSITVAI